MLEMIKEPTEDPKGIKAEDLGTLRELLTCWMVAEPARHRSMTLISVLTLEKIRAGALTFQNALKDDGEFAMVGKGTAADGRRSELREEEVLRGEYKGDPAKESKVARKQISMLMGANPDRPDATLLRILREYGGV